MKIVCFAVGLLVLLAAAETHAEVCPAPRHITKVAVPGHPFSALADSTGCWLFVSVSRHNRQGSVIVLHDKNGVFELDHAVVLKTSALGEALTHDGSMLIVAGGRGTSLLDVARLEQRDGDPVLGVLPGRATDGAVFAAISPDDRLLFVADEDAREISVFDVAKMRAGEWDARSLIGRIPVAPGPVGMAFSPDGRWLFATSEVGPGRPTCSPEDSQGRMHPQGVLLRIDVAKAATDPAHALADALPAGCNPVRVAVSSASQVWVTVQGDNALMRVAINAWLAGNGHASAETYHIGTSPVGIAVRPDGRQIWVALSNRFERHGVGGLARLTQWEGHSQMTLLTLPAARFPRELTFLPDGRTLVATLFEAGQIEFVPTANQ